MVKFDIQYPYGEKQEQYESVAKVSIKSPLLVAEVPIHEYGDKENVDLLDRYGIAVKDLPVLKLFVDGEPNNAIEYNDEIKADAIIRFVKKQTGIRLPLDKCLAEFDTIAEEFVGSEDKGRRVEILNDAKRKAEQISDDTHKSWAQVYLKIMDKVIDNGESFVDNEQNRIEALLNTKLSDNKKSELKGRLNVLLSFKKNKVVSDQSNSD